MPRALLFVNSRASQTGECFAEIARHLEAGGLQVERGEVADDAGYTTVLQERKGTIDLVIAAGGDGTVRCLSEAAYTAAPQLPLGIIPLGTANNVARSLGLPLEVDGACGVILGGQTTPMDLARVNGRIFVSVVGIGLSTRVHEEVPAEQKKRWGSLAYAWQAAKLLVHRTPFFRVEIRSPEGTHHAHAVQVTVCNGRYYGAHLEINPEATLSDGQLDLSIIERRNPLLGFFKTLLPLPPRHASPGLRLLRAGQFDVSTRPVMKIDVEGSTDLCTPAHFEVLPAAIRVFSTATVGK